MAEFVKGDKLNAALEDIFENAEAELTIISPYIKIHSRYIDILKSKKDNHSLQLTIVFGKNEENLSKSLSKDEFDFLKGFPNIEIKYESRLHAKYYSNESTALLTSMNLYDFSQNNNIEFGVKTKCTLVGGLTGFNDKIDVEAFNYFDRVIKNSKTLYKRTPVYENKNMGLTKKYSHSDITVDELSGTLGMKSTASKTIDPKQEMEAGHIGYCIRTGDKIPYNPARPLSDAAFKLWNKYKNKDFKEKYCHYSGEPSNGETSFAQPIMKKNLNKIK